MPDSPQTRSSRNNRGHQRVCRVSRSNRSGRSSRVQQAPSSSSSSLSSCSSTTSPLTHTTSVNTLSGGTAVASCGVTSFTNSSLSPPPYYPNHTNSSVALAAFCPVSSPAVTLNGVGPAIQLPQYTLHPCHYTLPPYSSAVALTPTNNSSIVASRPSPNSSTAATMTASPFYGGVPAPQPPPTPLPPSYTAVPRVSSGHHHHHRHHTSATTNNNNNNNNNNRHHCNSNANNNNNNNSSSNSHHHHHHSNNSMNTGSNPTAAATTVTSASSVSSSSTTLSLGNSGGGGGGGSSSSSGGSGGHSSSSLASFSVGHHGYHHLSSTPSSTAGSVVGGGGSGLFSSAASAAAFISSGHHHNHRRLLKHRERNILSAVVSMLVIVVLCTALVEPNWIAVSGGGCKEKHLGVYQFFYPGYFLEHRSSLPIPIESNNQGAVEVMVPGEESNKMVNGFSYKYGPGKDEVLVDCITLKGVWLMKSIIVFTFLAIAWSLCSFFLDLLGPTQRGLKLIHRNAISSITTVIICVLINGLCYLLTIEVKDVQMNTKPYPGNRVSVTFSVSFYLIATAGGLAVLGTACNCLRHYPVRVTSDPEPLLDDYDRLEQVFYPPGPLPEIASMTPMVPPPAYSP
ncbi:Hypothetical predicted protein [Argonauta hians]